MNHYYRVLGLPSTATQTQIKKAYRKLVMQYHPDRNPNPGARQKFIDVDQAYDYLTSARTRRFYQSKKRYTTPVPKQEEPKTHHQMNDDERRKAFERAKIKKAYMERKKWQETNFGCLYGVLNFVPMMVMPYVGYGLGISQYHSKPIAVFLAFSLPILCVIPLNYLAHRRAVPKREKLHSAYKKELSDV